MVLTAPQENLGTDCKYKQMPVHKTAVSFKAMRAMMADVK